MAQLTIVTGDATRPTAPGPKIIVHVCNDVGGWGAGFVVALSKRWPEPEAAYRAWAAGGDAPFALGEVQLVEVTSDDDHPLFVANLVGQHGLRTQGGVPPIRYPAIADGLARVAEHARRLCASVHMPRIGCGLAGGTWDEIGPLVEAALVEAGVDVTVYDFG